MVKHKIIIIGTGNMGKRHLQAISNLNVKKEIRCYDVSKKSLDSIDTFCKENNIKFDDLKLETDFSKTISNIDSKTIIIIASTAKGRKEIFEKVIPNRPMAIICEKPVCQKNEEYKSILELNKNYKIKIYINLPRHVYPDYQEIYNKIKNKNKINFSINDPKMGFGCNGIHYIELITWLLNAKEYKILDSKVISTYKSKRKGFSEFSGKLILEIDSKHKCIINMDDEDTVPFVEITSEKVLFKIFEEYQKMIIANREGNIDIKNFVTLYCSQITDKVIEDIINNKNPKLPSIDEVYLPHKILFDFMKKHNIEDLNFT